GPGNLGRVMAQSLHGAGYPITEIVTGGSASSRKKGQVLASKVGARVVTTSDAALNAGLVCVCVPDREIAKVARELAASRDWKSKVAVHASGALDSGELKPLREKGAAVASLHPLMTFVAGAKPMLDGVPFAVEGDAAAVRVARQIVRALKGNIFAIPRDRKPAYHAWGGFTSPLLVAFLVTGEEVARLAGIQPAQARRRMLPIVRQTLCNYEKLGAAGAFSGPIVRGDIETVRKHLQALKKVPLARELYLALARSAIKNLPAGNRKALRVVLNES